MGGATLRPLFRSFYNLSTHSGAQDKDKRVSTHHSHWGSGRTGYFKKPDGTISSSLGGNKDIQLRSDVLKSGSQGETITSIRSPFGDSSEAVGRGEGGEGQTGISVHKTVVVSRLDSDSSSVGSGSIPWGLPGHGNTV